MVDVLTTPILNNTLGIVGLTVGIDGNPPGALTLGLCTGVTMGEEALLDFIDLASMAPFVVNSYFIKNL